MATSAQSRTPVLPRLTERREAVGLTKSELARRMDVNFSAVFRWETGDAAPAAEKLSPLADVLECSLDYLFGRTPNVSG